MVRASVYLTTSYILLFDMSASTCSTTLTPLAIPLSSVLDLSPMYHVVLEEHPEVCACRYLIVA